MLDKHDLIVAYKKLAEELGREPEYALFIKNVKNAQFHLTNNQIKFSEIKARAKLEYDPVAAQKKLIRQYQAICAKREQLQGFFRTTLDLSELFQRAGNPPVLKLSAQPDTHGKFADYDAWNCYLKFLRYWKPHVHLIMGDFVDCEGLSHWEAKDLEPRRIVPEMKSAREMLQKTIDSTLECTTRIYLEGNHERWITDALCKMPELFDGLAELDIEISLKTLLGLPKFGYELYPLNELVQIGKAHFTHGVYTPTHHAKKHLDEFKTNIYYGHLHDLQEHNNTSVDGPMEAASLGCLCRLDAKFLKGRKNNWAHAHGAFEFFPDGSYNFYKIRILNGVTSYNGVIFNGKEP